MTLFGSTRPVFEIPGFLRQRQRYTDTILFKPGDIGRREDPPGHGPGYPGIASIRRNTRGGMNHNKVPLQASKSSISISATPPLR